MSEATIEATIDAAIDVVETRDAPVLGVVLKARHSGRVYRVRPARDPMQPRFWCVLVYRCTSAGVPDGTEQPWFGGGGMTRDELPAALDAIRTDLDGWLSRDECRGLRAWLLAGDPAPAAASVAAPRRPAPRTGADPLAEPVGVAYDASGAPVAPL